MQAKKALKFFILNLFDFFAVLKHPFDLGFAVGYITLASDLAVYPRDLY